MSAVDQARQFLPPRGLIVSTDLTITTDRLTELFPLVEDPDNVDPEVVEITI